MEKRPALVLFPFAGDAPLGGSHISAMSLAAGLDRRLFEPRILCHIAAGAVGDHARSLGLDYELLEDIPLMGAPGLKMPGDVGPVTYAVKTLPALIRTLQRIGPAIVHTNEGRMHANWALPTKLCRRRHVWHHRQSPRAFGANRLAPLLSDRIVSVSQFAKPAHPIRNIDDRFSVIRSPFEFSQGPVDRVEARARLRAELGLPGDAVVLGFFGSMTDRKRPRLFVEAVAAIARSLPGRAVHGALFGEVMHDGCGEEREARGRANALGIGARMHFMGFRSPIEPYMAAVDVKLVTAVDEPFGRTLIEAMHQGTPIVATRHGGNPEAIADGRTGFLVDADLPEAFVAPTLRLLEDPALARVIGAAAHREVGLTYSRQKHIDQMTALYLDLLSRKTVEVPSLVKS